MKSRIIGTVLCILVLGATFWLITKAPIAQPENSTNQENNTFVPPQETIETEVSRAYVIETAHNAEDLLKKLAYESEPNYQKTIRGLSERLSKSASFLKDELQDYHGAAYFTKLSEIFQDLIDNPFLDSKTFSERAKKILTELENAYPSDAASAIDENDPQNPMYYPKFDTQTNGITTNALLAIYRMQYQENTGSILLTFGGNMFPGDTLLNTDKSNSFKSISESTKLSYPLYTLSSILSTDTSSFANLAVPLTDSIGNSTAAGSVKGIPAYAKLLKNGGIDVVSISNSNILSFGDSGKADTIKALTDENLPFSDEGTISYIQTKLGSVAYISYDIIEETTANAKVAYEEAPKQDIATAKEAGAKFIVVHFNWVNAEKNSWDPSMTQVLTARAAIDNGANLVFGSFPGAIEAIEQYKGVSIVYCAGDLFKMNSGNSTSFLFQQAFSLDNDQNAVPGQILVLPLSGSGNEQGLPTIAFDSESANTFSKVIVNSSSTVRYGVGKKNTFSLEHLNIISIEK